ncbi:hypothetical protein Tco_1446870 [Tanacetum coccineum]
MKLNKRARLKKPCPSSLPEQIFASATQQMLQIRKKSPRKRNFGANHEGKYKSMKGKRIYDDEGSSSEVMYEHYFQHLRPKTRAKLKESRTPLVGFSGEGKDKHPEGPLESKPLEKVVIHDDYPDQTITIGGNLSAEYRSKLIEILRKHADAFAWTPADMTEIPRFIAEHELKTYPHIESRVQRKQSIAPDRRKVVKEEVAEWLKAGIVRRVRYPT